ncbi:hypothetical protein M885DRAFT_569011 [Pelagophyceae sp. CCMP2097]|nr:hypothetical protein M885DRAFT_569011 [Pelagophyceae sp. CCMP2097]
MREVTAVVAAETHNLLTVMRLNDSWAGPMRFEMEIPLKDEDALIGGLLGLAQRISEAAPLAADDLLAPFCAVVLSETTNGLHKFLIYDIITRDCAGAAKAVDLISKAITHCRFEETDVCVDEIVLLKL